MTDLLSIGELARRSGLTVSALRFYDREGVLEPAFVDPSTGYRRYAAAQIRVATVVASLRRIALPLSEIRAVVENITDHDLVRDVVAQHLDRLADGLRDAQREAARLDGILAPPGDGSATVAAADLRRLLDAVTFAAATDPEHPVLCGVLLEAEPGRLRAVATDRYRLAVHEVPADVDGVWRCVAPAAWVSGLRELSAATTISLTGETVRAVSNGETRWATTIDGDFPDYARILPTDDRAGQPLGQITTTPAVDGLVRIDDHDVTVQRAFLLEATEAADGQATLALDGPITPLVIRSSDGAVSLLMPVRTDP
ncbi:MerR family transcriptional regulator [Calidifontibacter sp. DB0510]|uniref:MerR family transcriptional regulator n=1 Tax=Metallococcus carri TaxID=1656884 RepID=A0A967B2J2_9MICO|nr:MerR family transcriptional regulator [Metallococcus carri]NHN56095.1 MerR family transcriptional regulator [Metallococcus carri]NOP37448.1 MerR family transcriptional regulator [Calidifontibacter sp. DB2511S]